MALTVGDAVTWVRDMTRHPIADVRLTNDHIKRFLNDHYRGIRNELQDIAPTLHLQESTQAHVAGTANYILSNLANFSRLYTVEQYNVDLERYFPVFRASGLAPAVKNFGGLSISLRHNVLNFGPPLEQDWTFRYRYWSYPAEITSDAATYVIPEQLELPLKMRACALVYVKDHNDFASYDKWMEAAAKEIERVTPSLKNQYGIHTEMGGAIEVKGY